MPSSFSCALKSFTACSWRLLHLLRGAELLDRMRNVYARPRPDLPLSAQQLAHQLLERGGLRDVTVATIRFIPDAPWSVYYSEEERLFALSPRSAEARSVTAYAVVARESSRALRGKAEKVRTPVLHRVRRAIPWLWIGRVVFVLTLVWSFTTSLGMRTVPPIWLFWLALGICALGGALLLLAMRRASGDAPTDPLPMLAAYLTPADLRSARRVLVAEPLGGLLLVDGGLQRHECWATTFWSELMQGAPP